MSGLRHGNYARIVAMKTFIDSGKAVMGIEFGLGEKHYQRKHGKIAYYGQK